MPSQYVAEVALLARARVIGAAFSVWLILVFLSDLGTIGIAIARDLSLGKVLGAQALGWSIPFLPVQLLWLNLVTNSIQDLALAFEPRDQDVLEQPPRPRGVGILSALLWERMIVAGVVMAAGTLLLFHLELLAGSSIVRAQTIALTTMVLFQMFQVGMARSERRSAFIKSPFSNRALLVGTIAATALHAAVMTLPLTNRLLHLEPVDPWTWLKMLLIAASIIPAMELQSSRDGDGRSSDLLDRPPQCEADRIAEMLDCIRAQCLVNSYLRSA